MIPTNPWLLTATGHQFPLLNPTKDDVFLADIAQALGRLQRYNGHTRVPYTVAEHSVLVAFLLREAGHSASLQLAGLFHDAAEAYIGDMPTPIKWALETLDPSDGRRSWDDLEEGVDLAIANRFGIGLLPYKQWKLIKLADTTALMTESRDLLPSALQWPWDDRPEPHNLPLAALLIAAQWQYSGQKSSEILTPMELFLEVYDGIQAMVGEEALVAEYGQ